MEMLLMGAVLSMMGFAVTALAFGAATREAREREALERNPEPATAAQPGRFFADRPEVPKIPVVPVFTPTTQTLVPIEALLLQIENHVRLEHAAAESFLATPTAALLHSRTISHFIN